MRAIEIKGPSGRRMIEPREWPRYQAKGYELVRTGDEEKDAAVDAAIASLGNAQGAASHDGPEIAARRAALLSGDVTAAPSDDEVEQKTGKRPSRRKG